MRCRLQGVYNIKVSSAVKAHGSSLSASRAFSHPSSSLDNRECILQDFDMRWSVNGLHTFIPCPAWACYLSSYREFICRAEVISFKCKPDMLWHIVTNISLHFEVWLQPSSHQWNSQPHRFTPHPTFSTNPNLVFVRYWPLSPTATPQDEVSVLLWLISFVEWSPIWLVSERSKSTQANSR